jgi:hypothetical protein
MSGPEQPVRITLEAMTSVERDLKNVMGRPPFECDERLF